MSGREDGKASDGALTLREAVRAAGHELGFDQVGFAPATEPPHASAYLAWLERGWHGEMAYMAREDAVRRRLRPGDALPGCRTIVVASLSYAGPSPEVSEDATMPIVARYARGRDYHGVFEVGLAELAVVLDRLVPGSRHLPYVDYGPVLERDHAQRAGLGWIGKNTMLIHPVLGSYLLLGELLTTAELPPDDAFAADRCGTCARCIDACPTGAIRTPRGLDARLCISYLTIELRGTIPLALRPSIGARVFGCDICQEVCPWNDGAPEGSWGGSKPEPGRPLSAERMVEWALELLELSEESYRRRYRDTPFSRPGRDGMLRNLCVGLGNSGSPEAIPVLRRCAADAAAVVREHAEWALARLQSAGGSALPP